ncbi:hypothetical protein HOM13_03610 [Candidatus Woesearchaeota archaeon]|jgi:hypothetical protein|nr:hypothetical protein [Candidatus Woesearchaeota archaeon]MBT5215795.1 hypothetical protein [Candidatus Woesearchaeota archaeon]MBT6402154.1 hypothetical protein [Candidatus Woesearchaeota archaeon]
MNIHRDIARVKRRLVFTKFLDCFMDSLVVGLAISALLLAFGVSVLFSVIVGGAYLFKGFVKSVKSSSLSEIEKKIPNLEWQLRTAADNAGRDNNIINRLNEEVAEKVGFVSISDLLSGKRTIKRMFLMVLFGALIFYVQLSGFNFIDAAVGEDGMGPVSKITGLFSGEEDVNGRKNRFDIFGDEKVIELGQRELELELGTEMNEIDLGKEGALGAGASGGKNFRGSVGSDQDSSYSESYNSDEEEIIENFYNNLNK